MADWVAKILGDLCQINPPKLSLDDFDDVSFIGMADVSENAKIIQARTVKYQSVKSGFTSFKDGDILVAKITPCFENGKGAKVNNLKNGIGFGSTEFHVLRTIHGVSEDLIYYHTVSSKFRKSGESRMLGSAGQQRVPKNFIKNYLIDFPINIKEQDTIAQILITIDQAITKTEQLITKYERMKTGLMQDLFTHGINEKGNIRGDKMHEFKDSPLGKIPEEWNVIELGNEEYFTLATGGTPATERKEFWEGGSIPWMSSGEVHKKQITSTHTFITELGYKNSNARYYPKDSIVIALAGQGKTRGTVALTKIQLTSNQSIAAIIPNITNIEPNYVFFYLENQYENLRSISSGAGRAGLSLTVLSKFVIPLPSKKEQIEISKILTKTNELLQHEKTEMKKFQYLKTALIQDLLTGKVRVDALMNHTAEII